MNRVVSSELSALLMILTGFFRLLSDSFLLIGQALFLTVFLSSASYADVGTDQANSGFDHLTTGFHLSSAHQSVECSSCHVRGIYKGTPTACEGCHSSSTVITALGKNSGHINSGGNCAECHGLNGTNWAEIDFKTHDDVIGDCEGCHNDRLAVGKPPDHIPSSDVCEDCHSSTSTYTVGAFDHSGTTANCYSCHDGAHSGTPAKSSKHIPSTNICEDCHNTIDFDDGTFDHGGTTTGCYSCHDGKHSGTSTWSASHMQSSNTCESCHNALTKSWYSITGIDHSDVIQGTCDDCHSSSNAIGPIKSSKHIPSNDACDDCHNTSDFFGATFDHSGTTTNCYSCHDGGHSGASRMSRRHMTSSDTCESCHNAVTKDWYVIVNVDHSDVIQGTCDDCHSSRNAIGPIKSSKHIPSSDACDDCHNTSDFYGATFDHSGTTTNCFSCHDGAHSGASRMSRRHMTSSDTCESCHNALTKDWYVIVNVDHSDVIQGTCDDCHDGRSPISTSQPGDHIVSSSTCDNCHFNAGVSWLGAINEDLVVSVPIPGAQPVNAVAATSIATNSSLEVAKVASLSSAFVHPDNSANCVSCHDGSIATGQIDNHLSTSNNCESCHQITAWLPVVSFDHDSAIGSCSSCHNGLLVSGKPINHMNTTNLCEDCHRDRSWVPVVRVDHTATLGSCFSCHNRRNAEGKPVNHISSDNRCDNCHVTQTWSQVVMDHSNVTGSCSLCHNGISAPAKPVTHISSSNTCNDCHRRRAWTPVYRVDHLAVFGSCSSCHNGRMAEGKPANHPSTHNNCEDCHRSNLWSLVTFNHDNVSSQCLSCHLSDYKPQSHKKTPQINYSANELKDCAGSCHVYEDNTFTKISIKRSGPDHRPQRGAW